MTRLIAARTLSGLLVGLLLLAACSSPSSPAPTDPSAPASSPFAAASPSPGAPTPVPAAPRATPGGPRASLPRDEAPHDNAIEWWYYTGHLRGPQGERYGFQFVIFQAAGLGVLTGYVGHFAVTDPRRGRFVTDQRLTTTQGRQGNGAFDLALGDWTMSGREGRDRLQASGQGYSLGLELNSAKPPAFHGNGAGYVDFGVDQASYYYTRTRMAATGRLTVEGQPLTVTGDAWMDHQWGDFKFNYAAGSGWDWLALQLADGSDLMVVELRDAERNQRGGFGTYLDGQGTPTYLAYEDFAIRAVGSWTSQRTGTIYPQNWEVAVPKLGLRAAVKPILPDQEFDSRATTNVVYWEGASEVQAARDGQPLAGQAYVELTGYGPAR